MKHILSIDQFDSNELAITIYNALFHHNDTKKYNNKWYRIGNHWYPIATHGKVLANLFYEPSTRTSSSFYSAMVRLGGHVIPINDVTYSSVAKGETLEDTIRTMACYSDVIVLRHGEVGAAARAAKVSTVPIINAGDGIGEHPTQALLDFFTILMERGFAKLDKHDSNTAIHDILTNLRITMMGDLKHGRTVKSLAKLLRKYQVTINWVSPDELRIPSDFVMAGDIQTSDLDSVITDTDVLYLTRVQKERMALLAKSSSYKLTPEHMAKAKSNMVLMHPLPRVDELPKELDSDPRSAYFRQMRYGLFMRMAILERVLE